MGLVVVIGETARTEGFALGGARVLPAEDPDAVLRAWATLDGGVAVVVLTARASMAVDGMAAAHAQILTVVMPP